MNHIKMVINLDYQAYIFFYESKWLLLTSILILAEEEVFGEEDKPPSVESAVGDEVEVAKV